MAYSDNNINDIENVKDIDELKASIDEFIAAHRNEMEAYFLDTGWHDVTTESQRYAFIEKTVDHLKKYMTDGMDKNMDGFLSARELFGDDILLSNDPKARYIDVLKSFHEINSLYIEVSLEEFAREIEENEGVNIEYKKNEYRNYLKESTSEEDAPGKDGGSIQPQDYDRTGMLHPEEDIASCLEKHGFKEDMKFNCETSDLAENKSPGTGGMPLTRQTYRT